MKLRSKKQAYLKGLLLVALAANVTWEPAMKALKSIDAASSEVVAGSGAGGTQTPSPRDPVPIALPPGAAKAGQAGSPPPAAAQPQTASEAAPPPAASAPKKEVKQGEDSKAPQFCKDIPMVVRYIETREGSEVKTEIFVDHKFKPRKDALVVAAEQNTSMDAILKGTTEHRNELFTYLRGEIKKKLGDSCKEDTPAQARTEPAAEVRDRDSRRDRTERRSEGDRLCTRDERGDLMKDKEDRIECLLTKLDDLEIEDANGKTRSGKELTDLVMKIVRDNLKDLIIEKLTSDENGEVADGRTLLKDLIRTIKSRQKDLKLESSRTTRLIAELEALNVGEKNHSYAKKVREYEEKLNERYQQANEVARMNPNLWTMQNVYALQRQRAQLAAHIGTSLTGIYSLRERGLMSPADYSTFLSPYSELPDDIMTMGNLARLGIGRDMGIGAIGLSDAPASRLNNLNTQDDILSSLRGRRNGSPTLGRNSSRGGRLNGLSPRTPGSPSMGRYGMRTPVLDHRFDSRVSPSASHQGLSYRAPWNQGGATSFRANGIAPQLRAGGRDPRAGSRGY